MDNIKQFDKRILQRNLDKGIFSANELNTYLAALPDQESEAEALILEKEEDTASDDTNTDSN